MMLSNRTSDHLIHRLLNQRTLYTLYTCMCGVCVCVVCVVCVLWEVTVQLTIANLHVLVSPVT